MALVAGFLPAFLLSGFLFEIESMPMWLQYFTHIIPARYFVESLQTIFIAGDVPDIFYKDMGAMLLIGVILTRIVYKKTTKRLV
jgi:ABC-2 type transport system permease protein